MKRVRDLLCSCKSPYKARTLTGATHPVRPSLWNRTQVRCNRILVASLLLHGTTIENFSRTHHHRGFQKLAAATNQSSAARCVPSHRSSPIQWINQHVDPADLDSSKMSLSLDTRSCRHLLDRPNTSNNTHFRPPNLENRSRSSHHFVPCLA
jgi:hypothetical protein